MKQTIRFFLDVIILTAVSALPLAAQTMRNVASIPVIMVDGTPCPIEQLDDLALEWHEEAAGFLQDYQHKLRSYITRCEQLLTGSGAMTSPGSSELSALLEQAAKSTADYYKNIFRIRRDFRERIAGAGLANNTPVAVLDDVKFDDLFPALFPDLQMVSIDGFLHPAAAVSVIQEAMTRTNAVQQKLLYSNLEKSLTVICNARQANSIDIAKWVTGWGNFITRPVKELAGSWAAEYEQEFTGRINRGVNIDFPEQLLDASIDKALILLKGYSDMLHACKIPDPLDTDEIAAYQVMDMDEFNAPFTLPDSIMDAGDILGYDTSGWRGEVNDRIGGAVNVGFVVADAAVFIATKFNPVTGIIEAAFHGLATGWHAFTRGKKEQRLAANIRSALMEDRDKTLADLRYCIGV